MTKLDIERIAAQVVARIQEKYILVEKSANPDTKEMRDSLVNVAIKIICDHFHVSREFLFSQSSHRERFNVEYSYPQIRGIFFLLLLECTKSKFSLSSIGAYFQKDHATVLHGSRNISDFISVGQQPQTSDYAKIKSTFTEYISVAAL